MNMYDKLTAFALLQNCTKGFRVSTSLKRFFVCKRCSYLYFQFFLISADVNQAQNLQKYSEIFIFLRESIF